MKNLTRYMKDKSVKWKLNFLVKVSTCLLFLLGVGALFGVWQLNLETKELNDRWINANNMIADLDNLTSSVRLEQYAHLLSDSRIEFEIHENSINKLMVEINNLISEYGSLISENEERQYYDIACEAWNKYIEVTGEEFITLSRTMKIDEANSIMLGKGLDSFTEFQEQFDVLVEYNRVGAEKANEVATLVFYLVCILVVFLVVIATVISISVAKIIIKNITQPVDELKHAAAEMTQGRLNAEIQYSSKDELGALADSIREVQITLGEYVKEISETLEVIASGDLTKDFNLITEFKGEFNTIKTSFVQILREFNNSLEKIKEGVMDVDYSSDEIAGAAQELATGTGEQASAVEELTATIASVNTMAIEAAKSAGEAADKVAESVKDAERERVHMEELQEEMLRIKEISDEIEKIVTSIEEIASQTSLLSLNASIEAARAGEAGRGFAVVADQIGKLATDSAQAVITTKELIVKTVEAVDKGSGMTETAVAGFRRIIGELESFAEMAHDVSQSATAQAGALAQVEVGIEQISEVTRQNAASSEECSAISEELADKASKMASQIQKFKLHE
ncbi:MAG: MCP four helix bundle domain-containing protein [Lachnospiraceae bacterium]|nr:MCP four helix bundle domain-containing protein [Lachnospiraceae bacterium]